MANIVTVQELQDASLDAQTLGNFVNGDESAVNNPRLRPDLDVGSIAELRKKVQDKVDLQIATLPSGHKGYKTLADAQAAQSTLAANTLVEVTNDTTTANNGVYLWDGATLKKAVIPPKSYEIAVASKNLFDESKIAVNSYLNSTNGGIISASGWGRSGMIPVTAGQTYTLSGTRGRVGLSWFANATDTTPISYVGTDGSSLTITAPSGANFVSFNLYSSSAPNYSNVQFEQGATATAYQDYGTTQMIDPSKIYNPNTFKTKLKIDNGYAYLTAISDINLVLTMQLTRTNTHSQSTVFNFISDSVDGVTVRNLGDDVAPMRIDNTTVGANHGYNKTDITTSSAHGKTNSDVGSIWTDGSKEWVIVDVPSTTVVSVTARIDNANFTGSTLSHVSGATNTTTITVSSVVQNMWYQVFRDRQLNVFVDDVLIDTAVNKEYEYKDAVRFAESYSIMKKTDIVEWLIANKGQNPSTYLADKAYTVAFIYEFDIDGGCVIYFSGVGRKSIALQDQMITQSVKLSSGNGTVYYYVPKTKPFTVGGYSYNFALKEAIESKNPSTPIAIDPSKVDSGLAVNRLVQLNDKVGYATGYLPILDAELSKRLVNASRYFLEIRNGSLKIYPRLIDTNSKTTIEPNDTFAAIAYRKYFKKQTNRTSKYVVRSSQGKYLYLDWHNAALTDEVNLPIDLQGKQYSVVEKSDNVTVLNQFVGDKLLVNVNASGGYAYLVVKF